VGDFAFLNCDNVSDEVRSWIEKRFVGAGNIFG